MGVRDLVKYISLVQDMRLYKHIGGCCIFEYNLKHQQMITSSHRRWQLTFARDQASLWSGQYHLNWEHARTLGAYRVYLANVWHIDISSVRFADIEALTTFFTCRRRKHCEACIRCRRSDCNWSGFSTSGGCDMLGQYWCYPGWPIKSFAAENTPPRIVESTSEESKMAPTSIARNISVLLRWDLDLEPIGI